MARYKIWDREETIYTPSGAIFTAEEWIERHGWISNPKAIPVIADDLINGGLLSELNQMKKNAIAQGATFEEGLSNEELLEAIEAFEDEMNTPKEAGVSAEERIAAALEAQVMMSLPDEE